MLLEGQSGEQRHRLVKKKVWGSELARVLKKPKARKEILGFWESKLLGLLSPTVVSTRFGFWLFGQQVYPKLVMDGFMFLLRKYGNLWNFLVLFSWTFGRRAGSNMVHCLNLHLLSNITNITIFPIFFTIVELTNFYRFSIKPIILSFTIHNLPPWQFVTINLLFMIGLKSKSLNLNRWLFLDMCINPLNSLKLSNFFCPIPTHKDMILIFKRIG